MKPINTDEKPRQTAKDNDRVACRDEAQRRRAAALRANLARRKQQQRERSAEQKAKDAP